MELLTPEPEYAVEDDYRMALTTAQFKKEYDRVHVHTIHLLDAERDRVHCMERLLLRIENESLQLQVNQTGKELVQAREAESNARLQLDGAMRGLDHFQGITQASSREIENLRCELASLNAVASDSRKLHSEKARLSKELSSIQAEVEKLRSQNTSANTVLAEKQAVTRQLNALEVQLENEKRAHERVLAKQSQQMEEVAALASKLEEARRELEIERRHRQDRTLEKGTATTAYYQSPVAKNGATITKSVAAKDRHQEETPVQQQESRSSATAKASTGRSGVRLQKLTSSLHPELTIATPGAIRARDQQKRASTLPGDKSSFSITPFLNRTTGLGESSTSSDDELNETNSVGDDKQPLDLSSRNGHETNTTTALPKQLKPPAAKQPYKPERQAPTNAALDGDTRNKKKQKILDSPDGVESYQVPLFPAVQKQPLPKKRKLGLQRDRNLFDEDEDDNTMQDTRKLGRKLVGTGHTSLAGNRAFAGPVGFSPLKRDRKRF